ncbi:MAG: ornithine cyclodeaminase family protein [Alphaproteobacteria bacterium]|nr:ornithine cyclodeaminase family protein [Alphaproteobacteria bacterium]
MQVYSREDVAAATPYPALVAALRRGLDGTIEAPERGVFDPTGRGDTLLTMPAWRRGGLVGVKIVTVYPGNRTAGLPSVAAAFAAFDGRNGQPVATIDGTELTNRRTAAVSALAAGLLARPRAKRLLIAGAGALAVALAEAHFATHDFESVALWARDPAKARRAAKMLRGHGIPVEPVPDIAQAAARADVIAAATTATEPFLRGEWVRPGTHVSLMGSFTKTMAEADSGLLTRARIFADTRAGVLAKGGEVAQAITAGTLAPAAIEADLFELLAAQSPIRQTDEEITVFKSVGSAAFDLVAAELVLADRSP